MDDIVFEHYKDNMFLLSVDDNGLIMSRQEAERLFVKIGHTLQDHDVMIYGEEAGNMGEQPDG